MRSKLLYILSLLVVAIGIAFSAWNVFAKESVFCVTDACHVVDNFVIFGLSLWVYSLVASVVLAFLLLRKKTKLALVLLALALLGDTLLLVLMLFTAPCFNCLIIALIFAVLCALLALHENKKIVLAIVGVWGLLFIINAGAIVGTLAKPYAIYANPANVNDPQNATMRIYFSPSCPSCKELVNLLGTLDATTQGDISWYPVTESSADIALVRQMSEKIASGMDLKDAFNETIANPETFAIDNVVDDFIMQIRLLINQANLSDRGTTRIPFVEYTGMPGHFKQMSIDTNTAKETTAEQTPALASPDSLSDTKANETGGLKSPDALMNNSGNTSTTPSFNFGVDSYCDPASEVPC